MLKEDDGGQAAGDEVSASWYEAAVKPECLLGQRVCDALCIGLVVVDVEGRIQFANEAAKRCLRCARGIVVRNGRVAMTETSAHTRLCGLLAAVSRGGDLLAATDDGDRILISVSPLPTNGLPDGWHSSGIALLIISDPMRAGHDDPVVLMKLFGLTRKEAELGRKLCWQAGRSRHMPAQQVSATARCAANCAPYSPR